MPGGGRVAPGQQEKARALSSDACPLLAAEAQGLLSGAGEGFTNCPPLLDRL